MSKKKSQKKNLQAELTKAELNRLISVGNDAQQAEFFINLLVRLGTYAKSYQDSIVQEFAKKHNLEKTDTYQLDSDKGLLTVIKKEVKEE